MEDGLGEQKTIRAGKVLILDGLNPCFSGGWSRRVCRRHNRATKAVLILVLVEDGLGAQ